jgi:crotonobetainyl-CoA:carnitine CoA-transferase CaiB-like acyl-CoA transferase
VSLPLEGVRILDLTRLLPGNYCTLLLADLGADVVKVEEPGRGDSIRMVPPLVDGRGAAHLALNRGKRSVAVDLKSPDGAEVLGRLAERAHALVESFRPGVMERLGVGWGELSNRNPELVYCALTGYGQDGPYRDRAGHDINYIGAAGILAATGANDGPPVLPSVQIGDLGGGMAAALGVVAALWRGSREERGRFVDVSLLDVSFSWTAVFSSWYLATGEVPTRGAMPLTGGLACYRAYRCADGRFVAVGALEPRFWRVLCEALGAEELIDAHLDQARQGELAARLEETFGSRLRDDWLRRLEGLEACVGPVNDVAEAVADPQLLSRGMVVEIDGRAVGPGPAVRLRDGGPAARPAPDLGEHTEEVLAEAGLSPEEVADLRRRGIVGDRVGGGR